MPAAEGVRREPTHALAACHALCKRSVLHAFANHAAADERRVAVLVAADAASALCPGQKARARDAPVYQGAEELRVLEQVVDAGLRAVAGAAQQAAEDLRDVLARLRERQCARVCESAEPRGGASHGQRASKPSGVSCVHMCVSSLLLAASCARSFPSSSLGALSVVGSPNCIVFTSPMYFTTWSSACVRSRP